MMMREDRNQRDLSFAAKSGCIVAVYYSAAGKNVTKTIREQGDGLFFPPDHISAGGMSPMHWPPHLPVWKILEEQMISVIEKNHAVRIIHPVRLRCKMKPGTMRLVIF